MMAQQQTPSDGPFLRAVVAFFRFVVRLLFALAMGILLGVGLYYGVPLAYRNLVQPVQENGARIAALEWRVEQGHSRLQEENRDLQKRIIALETELTRLREEAAVQAQVQQTSEERIQQLEGHAGQVEGALEAQQEDAEQMRQELENALVDLSQQTESTQERLDDLGGRLMLLQTVQDLLKVRLLLLEENPGRARDVLALAVTHMEQAILLMPARAETLVGLQERMVELDDLIATRSFRVGSDLEALWANVTDLVVPQTSPLGGTVTAEGSALPTSTPSP